MSNAKSSTSNVAVMPGRGVTAEGALERRAAIREIFSKNFLILLDRAGMTQKEVAAKADMQEYEMSRYARGAQTPKPEKLKKIADALEVSPDELVPGYLSQGKQTGIAMSSKELENGDMWVEFQGVADKKTWSKIMVAIAENKPTRD